MSNKQGGAGKPRLHPGGWQITPATPTPGRAPLHRGSGATAESSDLLGEAGRVGAAQRGSSGGAAAWRCTSGSDTCACRPLTVAHAGSMQCGATSKSALLTTFAAWGRLRRCNGQASGQAGSELVKHKQFHRGACLHSKVHFCRQSSRGLRPGVPVRRFPCTLLQQERLGTQGSKVYSGRPVLHMGHSHSCGGHAA